MGTSYEPSQIVYSDEIIDQASRAFVRNFFSTGYGMALVVASVVNAAAYALMTRLGVRDRFMLFIVGLIAVLGPVYLAAIYFYFPRKAAKALKERLQPSAAVTITPDTFEIATRDRALKLPWSELKRVVEFPDYFILAFKPSLAFTIIPKQGLPDTSQQMVREAAARKLTPQEDS